MKSCHLVVFLAKDEENLKIKVKVKVHPRTGHEGLEGE
jgi:hypothetical protein